MIIFILIKAAVSDIFNSLKPKHSFVHHHRRRQQVFYIFAWKMWNAGQLISFSSI